MNPILEERSAIYVSTLGGFSLSMGERSLGDDENRSRKAWSLLSYLIINRKKESSISDLFDAVWPEGNQENPYGALKTLIFRIRKMLDTAGFPAQKLIVNRNSTYSWSEETYNCYVDVDRFEELCGMALNPERKMADCLEYAMEAVEIYKGDFLPKASDESWVIPISSNYHTLYQRLVCRTAEYLIGVKRYKETIELCNKAILIDRFEERFYYLLIYAIYQNGGQEQAVKLYQDTTELFYRERLMTPSEDFKELYRIVSKTEQPALAELNTIQFELNDSDLGQSGAYLCEYSVFKRLFQIEQRGVERSGDSIYLCLITVSDRKGRTLKPEIQTRAMERLKQAIKDSLRASDAFARYSVSQYILLLPTTTYENGERAMRRVIACFNRNYVRKDVAVTYSLSPVLPG